MIRGGEARTGPQNSWGRTVPPQGAELPVLPRPPPAGRASPELSNVSGLLRIAPQRSASLRIACRTEHTELAGRLGGRYGGTFPRENKQTKQKDIWDARRGVNDGGSWFAIGNVCCPVGKQKWFWRRLILRQPPPVCFHLMGFEIRLRN